jgi:hypothetical protein
METQKPQEETKAPDDCPHSPQGAYRELIELMELFIIECEQFEAETQEPDR